MYAVCVGSAVGTDCRPNEGLLGEGGAGTGVCSISCEMVTGAMVKGPGNSDRKRFSLESSQGRTQESLGI